MNIIAATNRMRWLGVPVLLLSGCIAAHAQTPPADTGADAPAQSRADAAKDQQKPATAAPTRTTKTLETIVVTAEYRKVPLQTAPVAATVLSGDELSRLGVSVVDQLQFVTPSATVNNFGQGNDFNIRGIGKGEHNSQTTTGVITYRDGVATFPGYVTQEPYYDISSVQILRGPQGTFGGQNAIGGAVLVDSNNPIIDGGHQGYILGQLGNYADVGTQGAVNLPISKTLAARVAFDGENRDSFYDISGPWTGTNARQRIRAARMSLLWKPNDALSVLFKTDYDHLDMGAYPSDPVNSPNNPFDITANADMKALDRFLRSVLHIDYKFANGVEFRSISGYQKANTAYRADLDGTDYLPDETFADSVYETIRSQEFNLISPDTGRFSWILGAFWQQDTYIFPQGEFVIGVPPGSPASEYVLQGTNPKQERALFGQVAYKFTDNLKLEVGGRYTKSTTSNDVFVMQYGLPLVDQQSARYSNFSGKVSLDWTVNKRNFLYAFVATGFRPGGLNVPVGLGLPAPFDAEKVVSTEVGWKAEWLDGHVRTQVDAFHNDYKNFQVIIGYPLFPTFGIEVNTPNPTHMYGAEAQVQVFTGDWTVFGNLGWMRSSIGQFYATDPRLPSFLPCEPATGPASYSCIDLGGRDQTYAPNLTYSVGVQRVFHVGSDNIIPVVNYAHVSSQWATLFENEALGDRVGSRNILNAQVSWAHGDYMTTLYGTNLTNQVYIGAINSGLRFAGPPRQFGIRVTKFF
ncbi:MAG TPA: TonB-dependent receptor [Rhodanobacteraceae bacterium]|nr:TonB-dependent receptor [Rhodanobacteraceae bacterium]